MNIFDTSQVEPRTEKQKELAELASSYSRERELAFFVVNFGFTKRDYNELTEVEKAFIYKAYETKLVTEMTYLRNAVLNAINNAFRKKTKIYRAV